MRRLVRLLGAPFRLARAAGRHGVGPVTSFVVLNVRRRGLGEALRLGLADRGQGGPDRVAFAPSPVMEPAPDEPPAGDRDLAADYGLDAGAWAAWADLVGAPPAAGPAAAQAIDPGPALSFVLQGEGADPAALAATGAAIARLGGDVEVWPPDREGRPPPDRWVVFLQAGDLPAPPFRQALGAVAQPGRAEVVSFDLVRREADRVFPLLLHGANPIHLRAVDYLFGRVALRGAALPPEGRLADVDARRALLDWLDRTPPLPARGRWRHLGRPLVQAGVSAQDIQARRGEAAARARVPAPAPAVGASVVICTRDRGHLLRQLVRALLARPEAEIAEIIIVANGTANPYALETLQALEPADRIQVLRRDEPFNFSRLCNSGAAATSGRGPLLFLNDDIVPVGEDWLPRLMARLEPGEVGAVGPLLLYPDERVQHAGMYLGFRGIAGHALRGARLPQEDYLFTATAPREVSCLTGAVLLVRREAFEALNGFDEQLATFLQDVDLGLRLRRSGWLNVFDPAAVLIHMESSSIRPLVSSPAFRRQREAEHARFVERWGPALDHDPLHPAGFDAQDESLHRLAAADGRRPPARR